MTVSDAISVTHDKMRPVTIVRMIMGYVGKGPPMHTNEIKYPGTWDRDRSQASERARARTPDRVCVSA